MSNMICDLVVNVSNMLNSYAVDYTEYCIDIQISVCEALFEISGGDPELLEQVIKWSEVLPSSLKPRLSKMLSESLCALKKRGK